MKFDLTLTSVLVFLVPGGIMLAALVLFVHGADLARLHENIKEPSALLLASILVAAFVCGAITDSLRTITMDYAYNWFLKTYCSPKSTTKTTTESQKLIAKLNATNLPVFAYLMERSFEYYRLNANSFVAAVALNTVMCGSPFTWRIRLLSCLLALIVLVAGGRAWWDTQQTGRNFGTT